MQILGLCRFSYLGRGGFKVDHKTLEERHSFLYDPQRMDERLRLFEAITLPSIIGQTDPDFTLIVVTGETMPAPYVERLNALVQGIPQIRICPYPPGRHRNVMARAFHEATDNTDIEPCLQFRLDDDDAMGCRFVERFRETAWDLQSLWSKHDRIAVDFNTGYVFRADINGVSIWPYKYQYSAIALGMIVQPGCTDTIMSHGHHKLWTTMPTMTLTDEDMMMRGHNDFNDSRLKTGGNTFDYQPLTADQELYFKNTFNIDNANVREIFSRPPPEPLAI
ncbi:putative rhamnosyl transferase [Rhodobacteraceae bacterium M382]|nr:putative rhamnosyl transferase [Rhodobacteraceae bacterium M382]